MAEPENPEQSAANSNLRYVTDSSPGFSRHRAGTGFFYRDHQGNKVTDGAIIARIRALAIPPAWNDVWIARVANAHLQATGRDARGRKQYRYHPKWTEVRERSKYEHVVNFANSLPQIRKRVDADLRKAGLPREKVLAAIVRLLETSLIRVGNNQYAKQNKSYGLTTMRDRHASLTDNTLTFSFSGKSGVEHEITLTDKRLVKIVRACQDLPGQQLFQYVDDDGSRQSIDSADVNAYLREISGEEFTAKDFRTWAGTKLAAEALSDLGLDPDEMSAKSNVVAAIENVAKQLGNTPAICRKCYVHPAVIEAYLAGDTLSTVKQRLKKNQVKTDSALDLEVLSLITMHLEQ